MPVPRIYAKKFPEALKTCNEAHQLFKGGKFEAAIEKFEDVKKQLSKTDFCPIRIDTYIVRCYSRCFQFEEAIKVGKQFIARYENSKYDYALIELYLAMFYVQLASGNKQEQLYWLDFCDQTCRLIQGYNRTAAEVDTGLARVDFLTKQKHFDEVLTLLDSLLIKVDSWKLPPTCEKFEKFHEKKCRLKEQILEKIQKTNRKSQISLIDQINGIKSYIESHQDKVNYVFVDHLSKDVAFILKIVNKSSKEEKHVIFETLMSILPFETMEGKVPDVNLRSLKANLLAFDGQYDAAKSIFDDLVTTYPNNLELEINYLFSLNHPECDDSLLDRALAAEKKIKNNEMSGRYYTISALYQFIASAYYKENNFSLALDYLNLSLDKWNQNAQALALLPKLPNALDAQESKYYKQAVAAETKQGQYYMQALGADNNRLQFNHPVQQDKVQLSAQIESVKKSFLAQNLNDTASPVQKEAKPTKAIVDTSQTKPVSQTKPISRWKDVETRQQESYQKYLDSLRGKVETESSNEKSNNKTETSASETSTATPSQAPETVEDVSKVFAHFHRSIFFKPKKKKAGREIQPVVTNNQSTVEEKQVLSEQVNPTSPEINQAARFCQYAGLFAVSAVAVTAAALYINTRTFS